MRMAFTEMMDGAVDLKNPKEVLKKTTATLVTDCKGL